MGIKKLFVSGALVSTLLLSSGINSNAAINFKDLPSDYFAETQLEYLVNNNVINGYSDGTFKPNAMVTRGQFAAFVSRALKLEAMNKAFKDVPKTTSLFEEISKAATAGIIKGFADGIFKPNNPVTRADIAVMLDRAMQLKGNFTQTKTVSYSDYIQIKGGYADTSVKRLSYYGVMGSYNNGQFAPKVEGTREATVLSIYNLLKVIETGKPVTPPSEIEKPVTSKPHYEMTLAELKKVYGEMMITMRRDQYKEGIVTLDYMKAYYNIYHSDYTAPTPTEHFNDPHFGGNLSGEYLSFYPDYEVIAINGAPFTDTSFYHKLDFETDFVMPKSPKEKGQFYIDLHPNKKEFATYTKGRTETETLVQSSYVKEGALMVDLVSIFKDVPGMKVYSNYVEFNGKRINFSLNSNLVKVNGMEQKMTTSIVQKNGRTMVPVRSFAETLGLKTYKVNWYNRVEITNYPLETIEGLRE